MTTACVVVFLPNQYALFGMVQPDGTFSVPNVPSGTYALAYLGCAPNQEPSASIPDPQSSGTSYPAVWWKGKAVALTQGEGGPDPIEQGADLVTVAPGQHAAGYDWCFGCGAITITSITPGSGSLTIAFTTDLGPPTGIRAAGASGLLYTASCVSTDGGVPGTAQGTSSPITVTGLTPGAAYACAVSADDDGIVVASTSGASVGVVLASKTVAPAAGTSAGGSGETAASDPGSSMARTGASSLTQAGAGGALLVLGGALVLVGRGRRRRPRAA
jgi:hypothetical protein